MVEQTAIRTQEQILVRIEQVSGDDWLGFAVEVLVDALDYEHAKPYLKEGVTAEAWSVRLNGQTVEDQAKGYLEFAIGKIEDHRGISATRSVSKLTEYAWLLGRDDVVAAMDGAHYPQYGAPKVKAFADGMGWPWPDQPDLARMAEGLPCEPGCASGCGS